jgi:glycerol-3-phosphate dehydrogenase (NAD(P)+)
MEMIAEGYYGAKCIQELNSRLKVEIPIVDTIYKILYDKLEPRMAIKNLINYF